MKAKGVQIQDLFDGLCQYRVPRYQRSYQWQKNQWQTLWNDIEDLYKARSTEGESNKIHFLGAMVRRPVGVTDNVELYDIIDGQQRIISLILLYKAIYDVSAQRTSSNDNKITDIANVNQLQDLILNPVNITPEFRSIVMPSKYDEAGFLSTLGLRKQAEDDAENILKAYKFFQRSYKTWLDLLPPERDLGNAVNQLILAMRAGLEIVLLTLDPFDSDYEVFESLNAKGMKLSESDKIRNFCFMHIKENPEIDIDGFHNHSWIKMEHAATPPDSKSTAYKELDKFMAAWTFMRTGWYFPEKELYKNTTKFLLFSAKDQKAENETEFAEFVHSYFKEMAKYGEAFRLLQWPDKSDFKVSQAVLNKLWVLKGPLSLQRAAHPVLLYVLKIYMDNPGHTEGQLIEFLEHLESFVVRRYACLISKGEQNNHRVFAKLSHEMRKKHLSEIPSCTRTMLNYLLKNDRDSEDWWPEDNDFICSLQTNGLYTRGQGAKFVKYLLLMIEQGNSETINSADMAKAELDHIIPSKLTLEWKDLLGPAAHDIKQSCYNTVGNLVLLDKKADLKSSFVSNDN